MALMLNEHENVSCDYFGGCPNHIDLHEALNPESGWFVAKDGKKFCPNHIPVFSPDWRRAHEEDE